MALPWELFKKIEPGLTVFSGSAQPDPAYAPMEALLALPEMTEEDALNFIAERQAQDGSSGVGTALPNGQVAMERRRGLTYSVLAKATLPNGVWDQVEATIRLGVGTHGSPYMVLRWQEGVHD
jgi:general secretion pathway protein K